MAPLSRLSLRRGAAPVCVLCRLSLSTSSTPACGSKGQRVTWPRNGTNAQTQMHSCFMLTPCFTAVCLLTDLTRGFATQHQASPVSALLCHTMLHWVPVLHWCVQCKQHACQTMPILPQAHLLHTLPTAVQQQLAPLGHNLSKSVRGRGMVQIAKNYASAAVVAVLHTCSQCCVLLCRCLIHGLLERDEAEDYLDEIKRKKGDLR